MTVCVEYSAIKVGKRKEREKELGMKKSKGKRKFDAIVAALAFLAMFIAGLCMHGSPRVIFLVLSVPLCHAMICALCKLGEKEAKPTPKKERETLKKNLIKAQFVLEMLDDDERR